MDNITSILTAGQLAQSLGLDPLHEDEAAIGFGGINTLEAARPDQISFISDKKYIKHAAASKAGLLLTSPQIATNLQSGADDSEGEGQPIVLAVENVWAAVLQVLRFFHPEPKASGERHPSAVIDPEAKIAGTVDIGPLSVVEAGAVIEAGVVVGSGCYVGPDARIGEESRLFAGAVVQHGCVLGRRCRLGPGAVVGYDGFKTEVIGGHHVSIPQVGIVVLEDDVEIGANTTIDRASFHETRIGTRTKIDNLCQIGHNVTIGPDCLIAGQVGIAGSTKVGAGCMLGGQVGLADNIEIAPGTVIMAQSGASGSLERGIYFGSPCLPSRTALRVAGILPRLPEIYRHYRKLVNSQTTEPESGGNSSAQ